MTLIQKTLLFSTFFLFSCQSIHIPRFSGAKSQKQKRTETNQTVEKSRQKKNSPIVSRSKSRSSNAKGNRKEQQIRSQIVSEALTYRGIQYNYGGKKPSGGFDCSGFSTFVFAKKGISLQGSSKMMAQLGNPKSFDKIQSGDLAFFGTNGKVTHVAIVVKKSSSEFKVVHSTSSKGVTTSDLMNSKYWMGKYLFARDVLTNYEYGISGLD